MKNFSSFLMFFCISFLFSSQINASTSVYRLFDLKTENNDSFKNHIKNYSLITLNNKVLNEIIESKSDKIIIEIPLSATKTMSLNLEKSRVLSDGFIISTPNGEVDYTPGLYYHGKINGNDASTGSFSLFNNSVMGVISIDRGNYVIGTVDAKNPSSVDYIIYNDADMLVQNPFECHVDDKTIPTTRYKGGDTQTTTASCKGVELYLECDNHLYVDKGSNVNNVINYVTGFMNEVALIYANENINIAIKQIFVWTTVDPYPATSSSAALTSFQSHLAGAYNGDLAHLLSTSTNNLGGVSYVDVLCNQTYGVSYSNIYNTYNTFPTYSWTVEVVSHEMGHAFGSQHAHWCGWQLTPTITGPIDTCYTPEGGCYTGPSKPKTGTIMSYCHLNANISFNLGFGPLPGDLIRSRYNAAACAVNGSAGTITASSSGSVCVGSSASFSASASSGSSYSWTGPSGFYSTVQNPTIVNAQTANSGTYNVTATYNGCTSDQVSTTLTVSTYPTATITPLGSTAICTGGSVTLLANTVTGNTYQWRKNGTVITGATSSSYIATSAGKYKVYVTNLSGCTKSSAVVEVIGPPPVAVTVSGSLTFCAGGSVTLTASAGTGYTYQWRKNGAIIAGATFQNYTASAAGNYNCIVTNAYGCSKLSATKKVIINCKLSSDVSDDLSFVVSPNPFSDAFTINFNAQDDPMADIRIYDVIGKQIAWYPNFDTRNELTAGGEFSTGIFIAEVTQGDKRQIIRIVKK